MAKQVYSFTKIEKKRTHTGLITLITGSVTIAALLGFLVAAVVLKGRLPSAVSAFALVSFMVAGMSLMAASSARKDDDTFSRFINSGYVVSAIAVALHAIIFLTGILMIIT